MSNCLLWACFGRQGSNLSYASIHLNTLSFMFASMGVVHRTEVSHLQENVSVDSLDLENVSYDFQAAVRVKWLLWLPRTVLHASNLQMRQSGYKPDLQKCATLLPLNQLKPGYKSWDTLDSTFSKDKGCRIAAVWRCWSLNEQKWTKMNKRLAVIMKLKALEARTYEPPFSRLNVSQ